MRYNARRPLVLGDLTESTPPRHVVTTGVGIGVGSFDLNEELWVQGTVAEDYIVSGMFILLDDQKVPAVTAEERRANLPAAPPSAGEGMSPPPAARDLAARRPTVGGGMEPPPAARARPAKTKGTL